MRMTLVFTTPDHTHIRRVRAANVEREIPSSTKYLPFPRAAGQVEISFRHLPNARRADRVAVTDEAAAGIHKLGLAGFEKARALAGFSKAQQLIGDDFRDREAIVHVRAVDIARR